MKNTKSIEQVIQKENPEFVEEVASLSSEQLDARLAQLSKDFEAVVDSEQGDEEYQEAKAGTREMGAPYRDGKKAIKLKVRYVIKLLKDKGAK